MRRASLIAALAALAGAGCGDAPDSEHAGYVGAAVCGDCHAAEHAAWTGSHHDLAMQVADAATLLGDFANVTFEHLGEVTRFVERRGRFFVVAPGPDGAVGEFEVVYTFGVEPLQQVLVELPGGRLQALPIAWDIEQRRWFSLYPDERIGPGDPLHWTGLFQTWNLMCAECHSTDLKKRYQPETRSYATTWSEIDVACEACHGPGQDHVEWARAGAAADVETYGLRVAFAGANPRREVDTCAPCHSRRHPVSAEREAGRPLLDDFLPADLREGLYFADGQILDEVYVWGSFTQSAMYARGVRCSDCHDPHGLETAAEGDALCTRCHSEQPDPRFPSLRAARYDARSHHLHPPDSEGARCVACHMPARTYMQIDPRHDHGFRVPRPDLTLALGTPNACTGCHTERGAAWAAQVLAERFGSARTEQPHWASAIAAGRRGEPRAKPALTGIAGDPEQPAIVRATALKLLRRYGLSVAAVMAAATRDESPLVRAAAVGGLDRLPAQPMVTGAAPLLRDPIRAVRLEAVRTLSTVALDSLDSEQARDFEAALGEFMDAQLAMSDLPAAHLNLAVVLANLERMEVAEAAYRSAIELDPYFLPAYLNLANHLNALDRNADAERVLRDALVRAPDEGELHYSLGLLLAEEERMREAADYLGNAAVFLPHRARVRYNHALVLQRLGRLDEAEDVLGEALRIDPGDPNLVHALAALYLEQGELERARPLARRLVEITPDARGARRLLEQIENALAAAGAADTPQP